MLHIVTAIQRRFRLFTVILAVTTAAVSCLVAGIRKDTANAAPEAPEGLNIAAARKIQQRLENAEKFSFVVLGDSRGNPATFRRVLQQAAEHAPDFIVHTGDLTSGGKKKQYREAIGIIQQAGIPLVCIIGNHDMGGSNGAQLFANFFGPLDFYFDAGRYRFICINNNGKGMDGTFMNLVQSGLEKLHYEYESGIDEHAIQTLAGFLAQEKKSFIFMHRPPPVEPFRFHTFSRNADLLLDVLKKHAPRISRLFCGHIHGYGETVYEGVPCIATGGAGARLHKNHAGITSRYNYVLVNVSGDTVKHSVFFVD